MAQQRVPLGETMRHRVERVTSQAHGAEWSISYRAPTQRWVLPGSGGVHWRAGAEQLFVDELTAFQVDADEVYQLRSEGSAARTQTVVSRTVPHGPATLQQPRGWLLAPADMYRLRLAMLDLQQGGDPEVAIRIVRRCLAGARSLRDAAVSPAAERARCLLGTQGESVRHLRSLADAAHASPAHLTRAFHRSFGLTPHQYRTQLRIARALHGLECGERDLAGMASELGFASQSHFGAIFQRHVGTTPGAARRALLGRSRPQAQ